VIEGRRNGGEMIFNACGSREACPSRQTANARSLRPPNISMLSSRTRKNRKTGSGVFVPRFPVQMLPSVRFHRERPECGMYMAAAIFRGANRIMLRRRN